MVRKGKTRAFLSAGCPHLRNFEFFCGLVGRPYGLTLPVPRIRGETDVERLSFLKHFCGEMLENPMAHLWHSSTSRLSRDSRMSIAMSLFLYRKVLPSPDVDLDSYIDKMARPSPPPDPGFLSYVRRKVRRIFPVGWDLTLYPSACLNAVLPVKSCLQRGQRSGGCRYEALSRSVGWNDHQSYVLEVLARESPISFRPSRVCSVETGGKKRIVSVSDIDCNLMRPLHSAIYNRLSKFDWLLRGDAKAAAFSEFTLQPGQVFVSGDYESATDNLNGHLQREILDLILEQSVSVPKGIRESAPSMLSSLLFREGREPVMQQSGQLMGNLLSFPLLCLVNYLAFRYFSGSKGPVRVNGDDIVFRAPRSVCDRWMEGVARSGLVLSRGKTMVDGTYFSLNSTLFKSGGVRCRIVPFIRSTAFGFRSDCGGVESLAGRFYSFCPGFFGSRRSELRIMWIKWNRKWIDASRRSITRGLGLRADFSELVRSGMWDREAWYLSLSAERALPVKMAKLDQCRIPPGYELRKVQRKTKVMRALDSDARRLFVECAWSDVRGVSDDRDYRNRVTAGCPDWMGWFSIKRSLLGRARLLRISPRNAYRFLRPSRRILDSVLPTLYRQSVWLPVGWHGSGMCRFQAGLEHIPASPSPSNNF